MKNVIAYPYLFLIIFALYSTKIYSEKKNEIIDFSKFEIRENIYRDCPKKKECFKECSKSMSAMPNRKYDQFNTIEQVVRNECNRKCNEIICIDSDK